MLINRTRDKRSNLSIIELQMFLANAKSVEFYNTDNM